MTAAEKIMRKKEFIKHEADRQLPKAQSDKLWRKATAEFNKILVRYADLPKGVHTRTDGSIFPTAAIYLTFKAAIGEEKAYGIIEKAAAENAGAAGMKLAKLMRIPGMPSMFIKLWDPMTRKLFGAGNGFQNVFYPKKKGEYRMDVIACPYCRTFADLGCPELTKIFCENDERIYGRLPGLSFERTGTLGKGAARCDFCLRKI